MSEWQLLFRKGLKKQPTELSSYKSRQYKKQVE